MKGVYPFHDGQYEDFARVFDYLIKVHLVLCKIQPQLNPATEQHQRWLR